MIVPDWGNEGIFSLSSRWGCVRKIDAITGEVEIYIFFTYDCSVNKLVILLCYY